MVLALARTPACQTSADGDSRGARSRRGNAMPGDERVRARQVGIAHDDVGVDDTGRGGDADDRPVVAAGQQDPLDRGVVAERRRRP